ncbi:component of SufBCD complex [Abyssibius alkaniclasticus]|uniref:component of SufBCD complex n=1 Tax=Abyssibius alkaniclasticus TaxID=2881234 RepID=UPI004059ECD6
MPNFEILDLNSFWSLWYWILTVVAWSMNSHFTMGVPHDCVQRAERLGGAWEEHVDALAVVYSTRLRYFMERGGVFMAGFVAFILAVLVTLGFGFGSEIAQALTMLVAPLIFANVFTVRLALRVSRDGLKGAPLRLALSRRRLWNQVIGLCAILAQTGVATWYFLNVMNAPH